MNTLPPVKAKFFVDEVKETLQKEKVNFRRARILNKQELVEAMDFLGLKQSRVAISNGVHPVMFSDYLHNRRDMAPDKLAKIVNYVRKISEAVIQ